MSYPSTGTFHKRGLPCPAADDCDRLVGGDEKQRLLWSWQQTPGRQVQQSPPPAPQDPSLMGVHYLSGVLERKGRRKPDTFRKLSLLHRHSLRTFFLCFNYPLRAWTILACCSRVVEDTSNNSVNMGLIKSPGRQTTAKTPKRRCCFNSGIRDYGTCYLKEDGSLFWAEFARTACILPSTWTLQVGKKTSSQ